MAKPFITPAVGLTINDQFFAFAYTQPSDPSPILPVRSRRAHARIGRAVLRAPSSDQTFLFKARHRRWLAWQRRVDQRRKIVEHQLYQPQVINPTALPLSDQRNIRALLAGGTRRGVSAFRAPHSLLSPPPEIILIPAVELADRTIRVQLAGRTRKEMPARAPHSLVRAPTAVQGSSFPVFAFIGSGLGVVQGAALSNNSGVLIRAPHWRFVVTTLHHTTLTFLDNISYNRSLLYTLNKPSTATGTVDSDNPEINIPHTDGDPFLAEGNRFLLGFRREGLNPKWVIRFAGIILQIEDAPVGDAPKSTFTAYDPWEYLNHRPCRKADGSLPGEAGQTFVNQRGDEIAHALIRNTIQVDGPIFCDIGAAGGTPYYGGTMQATPPISITFAQGCTVGEALTQLCDTGTLDIYFSPIYDPLNRPGIISELNIFNQMGSKRYGAVMGWDKPGRNLVGISRLQDGSKRANVVQFFRTNSIPVGAVSDSASYAKYGKYWNTQTYQSEYPAEAVESLARETLLISKDRPQTIHVSPAPEIAPVPFVEYFLGDQLPLVASKRLRVPLYSLARVYALPINLDDNSVEQVQALEFSSDALTDITGGTPPVPESPGFSVDIVGGTDPGDTLSVIIFPS